MKNLITALLLMALLVLSAPVSAEWRTQDFGSITDLTTGTSAVYDTSTTINPRQWDQIAIFLAIDVTSGGGSGGGLVHIEGRIDTAHAWVKCWMINVSDSCQVQDNLAFSSTADLSLYGIVTLPTSTVMWNSTNTETLVGGAMINPLGFTELRAIITDTDWNAAAVVEGYWLLYKD